MNVLAERFRDACFWCAQSNDNASERALSLPSQAGEKERTEIGMNSALVENRRFITPPKGRVRRVPRTLRSD
jgi:hypothetical protein